MPLIQVTQQVYEFTSTQGQTDHLSSLMLQRSYLFMSAQK